MYKLIFFLLLFPSGVYAQKTKDVAEISTPYGVILVWLYDETPIHKASFIELANAGYWDSMTFNRVIPDFVIQGGCPDTEEGFTDSAYLLKPEFVTGLKNGYGAFAAGRDDNPGKLSARCQFYIVQNKNGIPRLDGNYTVYGKVIKGMDVVDKIANLPRNKNDQPLKPVTINIKIIKMKVIEIEKMDSSIKFVEFKK